MAAGAYVAFDLGASSGRAVVGRIARGRMATSEVYRFETPLRAEQGRLRWDARLLWGHLRAGFVAARAAAPRLRGLSVDSWAVDYVPLDAEGTPLRDPYAYRDAVRCAVMETALLQHDAAVIYAATGIQFLPFNTLYQVLADRLQEPALYGQTATRLFVADFFNHRFGGAAVVDRSMASTSQALDVRTGAWSEAVLAPLGLSAEGWPEVVPCGTVTGAVVGAPDVSVVAGCSHDTAAAVAAVPAEGDDWAYISCGTWSLMGVELPAPITSEAAREAGFTNEAGLGGTVRFLKNLTGLWALQECMRAWKQETPSLSFSDVQAQAETAETVSGVIDLEDPTFLAPGDMPARLRGWCRTHGVSPPETRGGLARLVLESIAESYRRTLGELETLLGRRLETIHLVGGGARNALLCRLTAKACRRRVVAGPAEATALGNLLVQAYALGDLPDASMSPSEAVRHAARASSRPRAYLPE